MAQKAQEEFKNSHNSQNFDEESSVEVDEESVKLVVFRLLEDYYAFYGNVVKEILPFSLPFSLITYVPGTPEFILGIINVRGDIESVLDIHKFMGFSEVKPTSNSRIIIAEKNEVRSGILTDSVEDVLDVPLSQIHPALSTLHSNVKEFVIGEITYNDRMNILLDIGKIFEKMTS